MGMLVASSMQMLLKTEDCNYYNSLPCRLAGRPATFITIHEILSSDGAFMTLWVEQIGVVLLLQELPVGVKKNVLHFGSWMMTMRHSDQTWTIEGRCLRLTERRRDLHEQLEDGGRA